MPRTGVASRRSIEPGLAGRVNPVSTGGGAWAPTYCLKPILLAGGAAADCRANAERIAARRLTRSLTRLVDAPAFAIAVCVFRCGARHRRRPADTGAQPGSLDL